MSQGFIKIRFSLKKIEWKNLKSLNVSKKNIEKMYADNTCSRLGYSLKYLKNTYKKMGKINLSFSRMGCTNYEKELEKYEVWLSECDLHNDNKC